MKGHPLLRLRRSRALHAGVAVIIAVLPFLVAVSGPSAQDSSARPALASAFGWLSETPRAECRSIPTDELVKYEEPLRGDCREELLTRRRAQINFTNSSTLGAPIIDLGLAMNRQVDCFRVPGTEKSKFGCAAGPVPPPPPPDPKKKPVEPLQPATRTPERARELVAYLTSERARLADRFVAIQREHDSLTAEIASRPSDAELSELETLETDVMALEAQSGKVEAVVAFIDANPGPGTLTGMIARPQDGTPLSPLGLKKLRLGFQLRSEAGPDAQKLERLQANDLVVVLGRAADPIHRKAWSVVFHPTAGLGYLPDGIFADVE